MLASGIDMNARGVLRFSATEAYYRVTHTITTGEVNDGGLLEFNITLGSIQGDVNDEGYLTTADAAIVLKMAFRGEYSEVADVRGAGAVTSLDAPVILQEVGAAS
jgi:hypothetical protein